MITNEQAKMTNEQINEQFTCSKIKERLKELSHVDKVRFAVFSADQVIDIYEAKYKNNKPRLAIDAAKLFIKEPTEENKEKCKDAAAAADADAYAYAAAAAYAYAAAAAAYAAAAADAYAAAAAAYAAAAAAAAYAAAAAADADAKLSLKGKILGYLSELENPAQLEQEVEWDGEGLPPVGLVCEARYRLHGDDWTGWFECRMQAGYLHKIWIYETTNLVDHVIPAHDLEFRKPLTQAEKAAIAREEAAKDFYRKEREITTAVFGTDPAEHCCWEDQAEGYKEYCRQLVDLTGYRKVES